LNNCQALVLSEVNLNETVRAIVIDYDVCAVSNSYFGRAPDADGGFSWERTDLIDALKSMF